MTPGGQTNSTVSSSARDTAFVTNIWTNILSDAQRKLFSSKVSSSTNHWDILTAFYSQYNEAKKTAGGDDATPFDVLGKMELFTEELTPFSPIKDSDNDDERDDTSEDTSDTNLKSLWSVVESTPYGQLIKTIDSVSTFLVFCHLYDASFSALTAEESSIGDVNGFMVIDNIFTASPLQIKPDLLEKALTALGHATKEEAGAIDGSGLAAPAAGLSFTNPTGPADVAEPDRDQRPSTVVKKDPLPVLDSSPSFKPTPRPWGTIISAGVVTATVFFLLRNSEIAQSMMKKGWSLLWSPSSSSDTSL